MGHAAVLVRGPAPVPGDVRRDQREHSLPLETERATSRDTRQEKHAVTRRHDAIERAIMKVTDVLCLSAVTIHGLVLEWLDAEGLDVRPGDTWVRQLLRGMRLSVQEARQVLEGAPHP